MEIQKINFEEVHPFTKRDIKYRNHPETFRDFFAFSPDLSGFAQAIESRTNYPVDRKLLQEVLYDHYSNVELSQIQTLHLQKLAEDSTYTVVTAHQPSLLTGPLYYIYKIYSAINLAASLQKQFPNHHFVPVFISGSEDHDFAEINHLNIFNRRIEWQNNGKGPVGRLSPEGLSEVMEEVKSLFGNSAYGGELTELFDFALTGSHNYNEVVFKLLHRLFAGEGLIVFNMDDVRLKHRFKEVMKKELFEHPSADLIRVSQEKWQELGYHSQAHAREINLFYMEDGLRERIVAVDEGYSVNNTELNFTRQEMLQLVNDHPEKLSPNVVLRPLYEEFILPNLAYIGGGGELAYWLERKSQFQHFGIFYPILVRRDSMLWVSKNQMQTLQKLGMRWQDLFLEEPVLIDKYIRQAASFDISLEEEQAGISEIFLLIAAKASGADKTLEAYVESEKIKVVKAIEHIEQRIKRAIKKNEEVGVGQLRTLKNKLFPNGGLQERNDNFIQFYLMMGPGFFETIKKEADPLQPYFTVITNH